jgi:SAM-dependent methyltransferase
MLRPMTPTAEARFDDDYWTSASVYRRFDSYDDALRELRGFNRGLLRRIEPHLPPGRRHVDAGCGHGAVVHELLDRGWDAQGFDLSHWMIDHARQYAPARAERFAVGDLFDVPFEGRFDLITCFQVLEHVDNPVPAIEALAGRLRPGGRLAVTTPNLRGRVPFWPDPLTADPTHVSVHEPSWWEGAVERAGLRVVHRSTQVPVPLIWRVHPKLGIWLGLGPRFGPDALVVGEAQA